MFGIFHALFVLGAFICYSIKKFSHDSRNRDSAKTNGDHTYIDYDGKFRSTKNNSIARERRNRETGDLEVLDLEYGGTIENISFLNRKERKAKAEPGTVAILYNDFYYTNRGRNNSPANKHKLKGYRYENVNNSCIKYGLVNFLGHNIYVDLDTYEGICVSDGDRKRTKEAYEKGKRYYKDGLTPGLVVKKYNEFVKKTKEEWADYDSIIESEINRLVYYEKDDAPLKQWEINHLEDL